MAGQNRKLGSAEMMVSLLGPEWAEKGRERVWGSVDNAQGTPSRVWKGVL